MANKNCNQGIWNWGIRGLQEEYASESDLNILKTPSCIMQEGVLSLWLGNKGVDHNGVDGNPKLTITLS